MDKITAPASITTFAKSRGRKIHAEERFLIRGVKILSVMQAYIESVQKRFRYYKDVAERAMAQLNEAQLFQKPSSESNSIAVIVNHLHGNMRSRWTNFFTEDGEKEWRRRDEEFEDRIRSKKELREKWDAGWQCVFDVIDHLTVEDLNRSVTIRGEAHSVIDAVNRQLTHYAYHIGEIVYVAKMYKDHECRSLTIPKGMSEEFNRRMKNR